MKENIMQQKNTAPELMSMTFGILVAVIGVANLLLVHPVPGMIYLLISLIYFPVADNLVIKSFDVPIPAVVKIILAIVILWFTLGISDLGDMIDKF